MFDKKPGEISDVGTENKGDDQASGEDGTKEDANEDDSEEFHEAAAEAPRMGWLYNLWPTGGRFFSAVGLQKCTIL